MSYRPMDLGDIYLDIRAGSMEPVSINSKTGVVHLAVGAPFERRIVCGRPVAGQAIYPRPNFRFGNPCPVCWERWKQRLDQVRAQKCGNQHRPEMPRPASTA